ncbi:MAG TPA: FlgD immunoglobulin-like domain containing protein [Clostridia bacterium]|nr:FlgD immunoglobulin-like domain containing protein [Clostridia bacterium]
MRRLLIGCLLLFFCAICPAAAEPENVDAPQYRALLIACDEYVTYPDTSPISHNNLLAMEAVLESDIRGFTLRRQDGITQSVEALKSAILSAFADATDGDVSILYISTHGDFDPGYSNPEGVLVLSDGMEEEKITAQALQAILDQVPGTKVLLVDACNAGALIGKGISPDDGPERVAGAFTGADYKALVSSGGSEPSWYWTSQATEESPPLGSSYFTVALTHGAGLAGDYAADKNRDGNITLSEMYQFLLVNHAASTPQVYPQDDDFVLFSYDPLVPVESTAAISGVVFDRSVLTADSPTLEYSFTAAHSMRVGYQLVYMRDGVWDWSSASVLRDNVESPDQKDGGISAGRKYRTLTLSNITPTDWGYVMFNIIDFSDGGPVIYASRVLSVQPQYDYGEQVLTIQADEVFRAEPGKELAIFVGHVLPCNLTVSIYDQKGNVVRRLTVGQATRPQGLRPNGSLFYWNGLDQNGDPIPDGEYTLRASTRIGNLASYQCSVPFSVQRENGSSLPPL